MTAPRNFQPMWDSWPGGGAKWKRSRSRGRRMCRCLLCRRDRHRSLLRQREALGRRDLREGEDEL